MQFLPKAHFAKASRAKEKPATSAGFIRLFDYSFIHFSPAEDFPMFQGVKFAFFLSLRHAQGVATAQILPAPLPRQEEAWPGR